MLCRIGYCRTKKLVCLLGSASAAQDSLIRELFGTRKYDERVRPVQDASETIEVTFGLTLNILVFVVRRMSVSDENPTAWIILKSTLFDSHLMILSAQSDRDQMMKTNGYLELVSYFYKT